MSSSSGKGWEGSCSDASSSPPVKGESQVLSPDGAAPPVPVASSSPLPLPAEQDLQVRSSPEIFHTKIDPKWS